MYDGLEVAFLSAERNCSDSQVVIVVRGGTNKVPTTVFYFIRPSRRHPQHAGRCVDEFWPEEWNWELGKSIRIEEERGNPLFSHLFLLVIPVPRSLAPES